MRKKGVALEEGKKYYKRYILIGRLENCRSEENLIKFEPVILTFWKSVEDVTILLILILIFTW